MISVWCVVMGVAFIPFVKICLWADVRERAHKRHQRDARLMKLAGLG